MSHDLASWSIFFSCSRLQDKIARLTNVRKDRVLSLHNATDIWRVGFDSMIVVRLTRSAPTIQIIGARIDARAKLLHANGEQVGPLHPTCEARYNTS